MRVSGVRRQTAVSMVARSFVRRTLSLEPLEPRVLLSADLVGSIHAISPPAPIVPGDRVTFSILATNQGDQPAIGKIRIDLYASTDRTLDKTQGSGDVLIGALAQAAVNLNPGLSKTYNATVVVPSTAPAGDYFVLADIDPGHVIPGDDPSNNVAATNTPAALAYKFGTFAARKNVKLVITDADGSAVTFALSGKGFGELVPNAGQFDLALSGTDPASALTVTAKGGDGRAQIHDITVNGSAKSITGTALDLLGDITVTGTLGSVTVRDVADAHTIRIEGASVPLSLTARSVTDLVLDSASPIKSITVANWAPSLGASEDANRIIAPSLGSLTVKGDKKALLPGDFGASIQLSGAGVAANGKALASATVAGLVDNCVWRVHGAAGPITVGAAGSGWAASFTGNAGNLTVKGDFDATFSSAGNLGSVSILGSMNNAMVLAGANLGDDAQLGGSGPAADTFGPGAVGKVTIGGQSLHDVIAAGLDPMDGSIGGNDAVFGGPASTVAGLTIAGAASGNSLFAGGRFASTVRIGGVKIDPSRDSRFLAGLPGTIETARALVIAVTGGTVQLPDGSSASIPAGVLDGDKYAFLSRLAAMPGNPPGGMVVAVGQSLSLSFLPAPSGVAGALSMTATPERRSPVLEAPSGVGGALSMAAGGGGDETIHFVQTLGAGTPPRTVGSVPMGEIIGSTGTANYGALAGTVNVSGGTADMDLPVETVLNDYPNLGQAKINVGVGNLNPNFLSPITPAPEVIWNGKSKSFVPLTYGALQQGKRTLVLVHGMLSNVDKAFGHCLADIMAKGHYDQVVGFNYDWTQHINASGVQLSAFLERLKMAGVASVDIEAHSEGGPVSLSGAATNAQSAHRIEIDNMVLLGGPIMGTPVAWEGLGLATMLMGGAAVMGQAPVAATLAELIQMGFAQDLGSGSGVLSGIRDAFAANRPNTNLYVAAGKSPYSGWLSWAMGGDNDTMIPVSSALGRGWDLPRLQELGVFPVSHTHLECDQPIIDAVGDAVLQHPGILVYPISGLVTSQEGDADSFTVALMTHPTADVTISLSSSNTTEGTVSTSFLTFTPQDWNLAQTVTVSPVFDGDNEGDVAYTINFTAATSADPKYNGLQAPSVAVTNHDVAPPGFVVTPTSGLVTSEDGASDNFTVALTTQPTFDVRISLSSSDTTEGTISTSSLTFTSQDWNVAQTVTVTGATDGDNEGDVPYTIDFASAISSDPKYNGRQAHSVAVTNHDVAGPGFVVIPTFGLETSEDGASADFTVALSDQPTADVTISLSSSDTTEGTVSASSLTFTPQNWNVPQAVTVAGATDGDNEGDVPYTIDFAPAVSADPKFNGLQAHSIAVTNHDVVASPGSPGFVVIPTSGLVTSETGDWADFTVALTSQPTADVTISLSSSDTTEGMVSASSLTFTPQDWNEPQTVTVIGLDDAIVDGDIAYTIVMAPAISTDPNYNGIKASNVSVTNLDNDSPYDGRYRIGFSGSESCTDDDGVIHSSTPFNDDPILILIIDGVVSGDNWAGVHDGTVSSSGAMNFAYDYLYTGHGGVFTGTIDSSGHSSGTWTATDELGPGCVWTSQTWVGVPR